MGSGNGTNESGARAERLRNENRRHERAIQNGFDNLPGSEPYRAEMESDSQVTAGPQGLTAKGIPRFAWWPISIGIGVAIAMFAWAAIQLAR